MSIAISSSEHDRFEPSSNPSADSLVSGLSFMLVANLLQRGVGFVRNILLCRFLTDNQLGLWALASSFFVLAAPLAVLGLPGTFGRMVESYRATGHLNTFLRRTASFSMVGIVVFTTWLVLASDTSSSLIFGDRLSQSTMVLMALTLCLVILFNCVTELLSGLRMPRIVSAMHTSNSIVFTISSLGGLYLVNDWRMLVVAFAISAAVGLLPAIVCIKNWNLIAPASESILSHAVMWKRVLPFAASVWCMNLLTNLFDVIDRYMLLFLASGSPEHGRALVGQFHSGRIMPVLLSSLAMMISGILLPYLAAEWEAGKRKQVGESMQLTFKCAALFFFGLSVISLAVAPILFEQVLQGKYAEGLAIMPQAMLHCCLAALAFLMQNYFWCAERGKTVGVILAIGLTANVLLNIFLVPWFSIYGAMLATSIAGGAILAMTLLQMVRSGVQLDRSCWWFGILPLTLAMGSLPTALILALACVVVSRTDWLLSVDEKAKLDQAIVPKLQKLGWTSNTLWHISHR